MATYTKTISIDFSGNLKSNQFHLEIEAEPGITGANLVGIQVTGDTVEIEFDGSLSAGEQTTLNTLISNHSPNSDVGGVISNISVPEHFIDLTNYTTIATFSYPGSNNWPNTSNIKVISIMETGGTSYDIKIMDITNNNQIVTKNLTNVDEEICDLGTLSNLPTDPAIFEVQAKIVGSSTVAHVKNVHVYHD